MTIACFIEVMTAPARGAEIRATYRDRVVPALRSIPVVQSVHLYTPDHRERPFNYDPDPPEIVLQFDIATIGELSCVTSARDLEGLLHTSSDAAVTIDIFESIAYPVAGSSEPPPRRAPLSFGVRYYPPVTDERAFVDHYLAHHPQLLGEMPGVKNVLCYVPVPWDDFFGLTRSDCIVGNEVVFNSFEDLLAMQASDDIARVRADSQANPVRPGPSTHFAFHREDFFG